MSTPPLLGSTMQFLIDPTGVPVVLMLKSIVIRPLAPKEQSIIRPLLESTEVQRLAFLTGPTFAMHEVENVFEATDPKLSPLVVRTIDVTTTAVIKTENSPTHRTERPRPLRPT